MRPLLALLLIPALAHADARRAVVGNGYALVVDRGLAVEKAGTRAHLDDTTDAIGTVTIDTAAGKLGADVEDRCGVRRHLGWTFAQLDAALARAAAFKAADVGALAPYLKSDPVASYVQIATDPKLAPLLDKPELRALRSARPGTAAVTADGVTGDVLYAPDRKLIAIARSERSWGGPQILVRNVELYDTKGKLVAIAPLPDKRAAATIQSMLRDLGFSPATVEAGSAVTRTDDGKTKSTFAQAKLGIVVLHGTARVLRGDTEVAKASVSEHLVTAFYLPDVRAIVAWTIRPGAEGCEATDPTRVDVIAVP